MIMSKKKLIASVLTVALLVGAVGASVYAVETKKPEGESDSPASVTEEKKDNMSDDVKATGKELSKEETVYVMADATGQVNKVIVSDWLQNGNEDAQIKDETVLQDIKNVKGNESYKKEADGSTVWDANGHDIYYQGTTDKKPPVEVKITYMLDGKPISASEIAGKSGKVTIRFDYTNNEKKSMRVKGKEEEMYVPFAMLTGMVMDNEVFSNIEVTNGKVVNEGEKTIITGLAFPGLADDLGLKSDSDIEIPGYFEITADAKEFAMSNTITVGTTSVFDTFNADKFDSTDLRDGVDKLTDGMEQLIDGSSELYDGMESLLEGTEELSTGVTKLAAGSGSLYSGIKTLDSKSEAFDEGADKLATGLGDIQKGTEALDTNLKAISTELNKINIDPSQTEALTQGVTALNTVSGSMEADLTALYGALASEGVDLGEDSAVKKAFKKVQADATSLKGAAGGLAGAESMLSGLSSLGTLKSGITQLSGVATKTNAGVGSALAGAQQIKEGTKALKAGTGELADGAMQIYDGLSEMESKMPELTDGVKKLADGNMELCDGLKKFRDEGISKITELVDGDLGTAADRLGATVDAAKSYSSFTGLGKNMSGSTKFIYKTEEIK